MTEAQEHSQPAPPPRAGAVLRAAGIYFALVFLAGLALGPVRVLWLEPWLGPTLAVLCEAPLLIVAMWFAAPAAASWSGLDGGWASRLGVGVIALVLQQVADLAVGFGLRGMTFADQVAYFLSPPGAIYIITLIVFTLMPLLRAPRKA